MRKRSSLAAILLMILSRITPLVPPTPVQSAPLQRYCCPGGAGSHDGLTPANAWTPLELQNNFGPGILADVWGDFTETHSHLILGGGFSVGGTVSNWARVRQRVGQAQAIFHGDGSGNDFSAIQASGVSYISFEGIKFDNNRHGNPNIWLFDQAHHIVFLDGNVHRKGAKVGTNGANGGAYQVWFHGVEFLDPGSYTGNDGDGIVQTNGATGQKSDDLFIVLCDFGNWRHAAMTLGLFGGGVTGKAHVQSCSIGNRWAGGINCNQEARNVIVEDTDIFDIGLDNVVDGLGAEPGTENGILIQGEDGLFQYNRIWRTNWAAVTFEKYNNATTVKRNKLYHNAIFDTCKNTGRQYDAPIRLYANTGNVATDFIDNEIINNICWRMDADAENGGVYAPLMILMDGVATPWTGGTLGGNLVKNNLTGTGHGSENFIWDRHTLRSVAAFEAAYPGCSGNQFGVDPKFLSEV